MSEAITNGLRGAGERAKGLPKVLQGFKDFISRGNAVELAVGVVIGAAFSSVVQALQDSFISPLIGWIFGKTDLSNLWDIGPYTYVEGASPIHVGAILNALLQFLITAAAIYFFVVLPLNALAARRRQTEEPVEEPVSTPEDVLLLQEIRDLLAAQARAGTGRHDAGPSAGPSTPTI